MANGLYDFGRAGFLDGSIDWDTDTIKVMLLSSSYTPDLVTHQFMTSVAGGARITSGVALASRTTTAGVADAADSTFSAVTGANVTYVLIYKDTGSDATSRLIHLTDTATGLPFTPSGGNVTLAYDNGSNKIFKL